MTANGHERIRCSDKLQPHTMQYREAHCKEHVVCHLFKTSCCEAVIANCNNVAMHQCSRPDC